MVVRAVVGGVVGAAVIVAALSGAWTQPTAHGASGASRPADAQPMIVRTVLSGDTVVLTSARPGAQVQRWGDLTVRLIGLDAPDLAPVIECFAAEAQGGLGAMLPEGSLAWVTTNEHRDSGGLWSMYVWNAEGRFVNLTLAEQGLARASDFAERGPLYPLIAQATEEAYRRGQGLWGWHESAQSPCQWPEA
ncbi:MAG: thermonuclease family protein [Actinobacteria bacterium]|nr:thermonuclease family protein [Actinomycetota bacterium]